MKNSTQTKVDIIYLIRRYRYQRSRAGDNGEFGIIWWRSARWTSPLGRLLSRRAVNPGCPLSNPCKLEALLEYRRVPRRNVLFRESRVILVHWGFFVLPRNARWRVCTAAFALPSHPL